MKSPTPGFNCFVFAADKKLLAEPLNSTAPPRFTSKFGIAEVAPYAKIKVSIQKLRYRTVLRVNIDFKCICSPTNCHRGSSVFPTR